MALLKRDDRVVDIWFGATGTVIAVPPVPPELDPFNLYSRDDEPWALVEWDYMGGDAFWSRQRDLRVFVAS